MLHVFGMFILAMVFWNDSFNGMELFAVLLSTPLFWVFSLILLSMQVSTALVVIPVAMSFTPYLIFADIPAGEALNSIFVFSALLSIKFLMELHRCCSPNFKP